MIMITFILARLIIVMTPIAGVPHLRIKIALESNPLKSTMLVGRLATASFQKLNRERSPTFIRLRNDLINGSLIKGSYH